MDDLDQLLAAKAAVTPSDDPTDALLAARATPPPVAPQPPPAPARFMAPPTAMDRLIASLPNFPPWLGDRGGAMGRLAMGAADPGVGLVQMGANAVGLGDAANKRIHDVEQQYQASRQGNGSTGFDPLRMTGNVGISLMVPGATAAPAGGLLGQMIRGGATGAAYNLAQPVTDAAPTKLSDLVTGNQPSDYWTEKAKQAGMGALFGAAGVPIASGLASIIRPNTAPAARALMDEGITLTPGQILGGGMQRTEDAATSIPVLGDFIRDAKNRTLLGLQRATYGRALDPVAPVRAQLGLPQVSAQALPAGPDGVLAVKNALGETYDALLPKLRFDVQTVTPDLTALRTMVTGPGGLPAKEAGQFNAILDKNLGQLPDGIGDGKTFKTITSNLGTEASNFGGATDGYQRNLGKALEQAQAIFQSGLKRSNPDHAAALKALDTGYANFAIVRNAAQSAGDKSHGFTPGQLSAAVRASDDTVGNGATATGRALMQDLSDRARAVLPATVADSGTPLRHAVQAGIGAVVGHSVLPEAVSAFMVPAAGAVGGLAIPYTQLGQKLAQKVLAERPAYAGSIAAAMRRSGGLLGAAAAPSLLQGS